MRTFLSSFSPRPLLSFVLPPPLPCVPLSRVSCKVFSPYTSGFAIGGGITRCTLAEIVEIEGRISRDLLIFDYSTRVEGARRRRERGKRCLKLIDAERINFDRIASEIREGGPVFSSSSSGKTGKDWLVNGVAGEASSGALLARRPNRICKLADWIPTCLL